MKRLLFAIALLLISSSASAQQQGKWWVLWYEATMMDDSGKAMDVYHHPVLETDTVIECNNARETSLVAEVKASNGKRIADFVVTKVEGVPKTSIIKKFYCYMYGYDPRFKK